VPPAGARRPARWSRTTPRHPTPPNDPERHGGPGRTTLQSGRGKPCRPRQGGRHGGPGCAAPGSERATRQFRPCRPPPPSEGDTAVSGPLRQRQCGRSGAVPRGKATRRFGAASPERAARRVGAVPSDGDKTARRSRQAPGKGRGSAGSSIRGTDGTAVWRHRPTDGGAGLGAVPSHGDKTARRSAGTAQDGGAGLGAVPSHGDKTARRSRGAPSTRDSTTRSVRWSPRRPTGGGRRGDRPARLWAVPPHGDKTARRSAGTAQTNGGAGLGAVPSHGDKTARRSRGAPSTRDSTTGSVRWSPRRPTGRWASRRPTAAVVGAVPP